jgi:5'-nucleotidase
LSRNLTIAVDVDEVVADLLPVWLADYNKKYNDELLAEDLREWDLTKAVKPECGKAIYDLLTAEMYDRILPIPYARAGCRALRAMGHRVIFVSSCPRGTADAKLAWLVRWGFLPQGIFQKDFFVASDKSLIAADVLIDDNIDNVHAFPQMGILVNQPHNRGRTCANHRIDRLADAPAFLALLSL